MAYVYAAYTVCVTIFSTGSNSDQFQILWSHALTQAVCSYVVLPLCQNVWGLCYETWLAFCSN